MPVRIFYDGQCAMCHGFVRFVAQRDRYPGGAFRFAPLGGESFRREVAESDRSGLPDSVVVVSEDGRILTRSEGTLFVLERLPGFRMASRLLRILPRALRDFAYDRIAETRKRYPRPKDVCPVVPPELRDRFDP